MRDLMWLFLVLFILGYGGGSLIYQGNSSRKLNREAEAWVWQILLGLLMVGGAIYLVIFRLTHPDVLADLLN